MALENSRQDLPNLLHVTPQPAAPRAPQRSPGAARRIPTDDLRAGSVAQLGRIRECLAKSRPASLYSTIEETAAKLLNGVHLKSRITSLRLILASASPRRKELLARLTGPFDILVSGAEEAGWNQPYRDFPTIKLPAPYDVPPDSNPGRGSFDGRT